MSERGKKMAEALNFTPEDIQLINAYMQTYPDQILQMPGIRMALTAARIARLETDDVRIHAKLDDGVIENTVEHNLQAIKQTAAIRRPDFLIQPLVSLNRSRVDISNMTVLTVGPRTEAEIFSLIAAGFEPKNIRGLDLISYSDFVDLGDMHAMPYGNDSFDVVILGWVLGYSTDIPKVVEEVIRVAKPGAYIAVGQENDPRDRAKLEEQRGFKLEGTDLDTTDEILDLFDGHVDAVTFREDVHPAMKEQVCHIMTIFRLK